MPNIFEGPSSWSREAVQGIEFEQRGFELALSLIRSGLLSVLPHGQFVQDYLSRGEPSFSICLRG